MESAKRMKPENDDEEEKSLSAFHFPDLTIKVGNEKLFVNRDQLMAESPVFKTMLTGNFKEKNACEIELPDKAPTTFALFLRHTLPGFDGLILSVVTAHSILPLVHEYQTNTSLIKIDRVLSAYSGENEYKSLDKLVDDILEAELYTLQKYLTACIRKASAFSTMAFERTGRFDKISSDTKAKIFIMRCKAMESRISNCMKVLEEYSYGCHSDCNSKKKIENTKIILS
ncbi:BTB and MATH domain-containing protein 38-like [Mytilus edulis]|uniref:BTB and MATH domain-containing protein 38-like n=1 Tax=Mytilus edulis TaxID=6550 RepID=UPI0039F044B0